MRFCSIVFAFVLLSGMARADEDAVEAKKHYSRGLAHFNLREYKDAAKEFGDGYRLVPDPVFLYNLAQCYRLLDDAEQALHFYRAFLHAKPDAPNRGEVQARIDALDKELAYKKSLAAPPDRTYPPNSEAKPAEPPSAAAAPAPSTPSTTTAAAAPAANSETPTDRGTSEAKPIYKKWWLWAIVGGVVVAGVAVGVGVGVATSKSYNPSLGTTGPAAIEVRF
jgi:tetratricopeptide (TPR) repeat protein